MESVKKILAPIVGYCLAVFLHSLNNSMSVFFPKLGLNRLLGLIIAISVMGFFVLCLFVIMIIGLVKEAKLIRRQLGKDLETGLFTQSEVDMLGSIPRRMTTSFTSLQKGGFSGWYARKRFNNIATELAFYRNRVERGIVPAEESVIMQELAYKQALSELRKKL